MTIASPTSRVDCLGNSSATSFSFSPAIITQASDLQVWLLDNVGNQTLLSQGTGPTNYAVVVTSYPGTGSITYPGAGGTTLATGWKLIIKQRAPLLQQFQPQNQGPFLASTYGTAYDYAVLLAQSLYERLSRTIQAPETDPAVALTMPSASARASQYAAYDSSGNPIAALSSPGTTPISSPMQAVVNAASTTLALSLLSGAPTLTNIAALRAFNQTTAPPTLLVAGFTANTDGAGGPFVYISTDTTSADNGGTIIVDASSRRWYRVRDSNVFNVRHFGATGNGATDDTAAINLAIAAAAANGGGFVDFPVGNYLISSTLTIGNGTSSTASTYGGVVLRGHGQPNAPGLFAGFISTGASVITWKVSGGASTMVSINGPLQGWGLHNLLLNGASTAATGLAVTSGQFGDCRNLAIIKCVSAQISSTTFAIFGAMGNTDSLNNSYSNIFLSLPDVLNAKGIILTGNVATNSSTDFNTFKNVIIGLAGTQICYGIYLQNCDSNAFHNILLAGGSAASIGVIFDYTASTGNVWPSGNGFWGIDTNGNTLAAQQWLNGGAPGTSARPNFVRGIYRANGATDPNLANTIPDLPAVVSPNLTLTGQTVSIGATNIVIPYSTGIYRISGYLAETTAGNAVTVSCTIGWTDLSGSARTFATAAINLNTGANNPQSFVETVVAASGTGISYLTTVSGGVGAGRYSLHIVVEKMS